MGGKSKKKKAPRVGSDYYMSLHLALCQGPIDKAPLAYIEDDETWFLRNLTVNQTDAYNGTKSSYVDRKTLFGNQSGHSLGGGMVGPSCFILGTKKNVWEDNYIQGRVEVYEGEIPSDMLPDFKGVTSFVYNGCVGRSPQLAPYSFAVQRVLKNTSGDPQWEAGKAQVGLHVWDVGEINLCFSLDLSGSMRGSRLTTMKAAMVRVLNTLKEFTASAVLNIGICGWSSAIDAQTIKLRVNNSDIDSLISFINSLQINNATYFNFATEFAQKFFLDSVPQGENINNIFFFVTDGAPSASSHILARIQVEFLSFSLRYRWDSLLFKAYGINIELENTYYTSHVTGGSVPVIWSGQNDAFHDIILNSVRESVNISYDMNPAHIIRECLTDTQWGMGLPPSEIDDTTFLQAAETLQRENFGLSFYWNEQGAILDFINNVLAHINAVLVENKSEGKLKLKLIRDDYDKQTVLALNETNVVSVNNMVSPTSEQLSAQVILTYQDMKRGSSATAVAYNPALFMSHPNAPVHKVDYDGITRAELAYKVVERDLRVVSTPLLHCDIEATTKAKDVEVGDVIKLDWPRFDIHGTYMRVVAADYGDGRNNIVRLSCVEDVFSTPEIPVVEVEDSGWKPQTFLPVEPKSLIIYELGYVEILEFFGKSELDRLVEEMESLVTPFAVAGNSTQSGFKLIETSAESPDYSLEDFENMTDEQREQLLSGIGGGRKYIDYVSDELLFYVKDITLTEDLDLTSTTIPLSEEIDDSDGQLLIIGQESIYIYRGEVARGVFDTLPRNHSKGSQVYLLENLQATEGDGLFIGSEVKLAPELYSSTTSKESVQTRSITPVGRHNLPYPPACVKVNGVITDFNTKLPDFRITYRTRHHLRQAENVVSWYEDKDVIPPVGWEYGIFIWLSGRGLSDRVLYSNSGEGGGVNFDIRQHEDYIEAEPKIHLTSRIQRPELGVLTSWQPVVIDLNLDYEVDYDWDKVVSLVHFNTAGLDTKGLTWDYAAPNSASGGKFGRCISLELSHWSAENLPPEIRFDGSFTVEFWHYPTSVEEENNVLFSALSDDGVPIITIMEEGKAYKIRIGGDYGFGNGWDTGWDLGEGFGAHFLSDETLVKNRWKAVALSVRSGRMYLFSEGVKILDLPLSEVLPSVYGKLTYGLENDIGVLDENGDPITLKSSKAFIDEARITCGIGRYVANYTPRDKAWWDEKWHFYY